MVSRALRYSCFLRESVLHLMQYSNFRTRKGMENRMKEISEQKYSRNMALSLLAGMVLGAAIVLVILWALGMFPAGKRENTAGDITEVSAGATAEESRDAGTAHDSEDPEGRTDAVSEPEPTETPAPPQSPELDTAQEPSAAQKPDASPEPETSGTEVGIGLEFQLSGSWESEDGYYYQYVATIENLTEEKITDWEIRVPDFEGCEVDTYWCCEVETEDGELVITPADFNQEIWEDSRAEGIGITIFSEKEWALTAALVEAETKSGSLNGRLGGEPEAGQGARETDQVSEQETDQTAEQETKEMDSPAGHVVQEDTPVGEHGRLRVENGSLVDQDGEPYQMHGVSTHGLAWFPEYVSEETFRTFRDDWNADVMRLAMYSDEYGGYSNGGDQKELKRLIDEGVEYASEQGMYVIIDWHVLGEGDPNIHKEDAIAFFDEVSEKYADYDNVIYEICNEPNGNVSWSEVKQYAEEVIPVIREHDPYGIILVGTPQWSQLIGDAAADPIEGYDNIMYTLHFYAATHKEELRRSLEEALQDGLPVFVSECSVCEASGNGSIDEESAEAWVELLDRYDVSYVAWAVSNKNEAAALIDSSCSKLSDWSDRELSETGRWFKEKFIK